MLALLLSSALIQSATTATAGEETVTMRVDMGGCASCVWIVTGVLERIPGVNAVDVSFQTETAVVRYDDEQTDIDALVHATTSYGFATEVIAPES